MFYRSDLAGEIQEAIEVEEVIDDDREPSCIDSQPARKRPGQNGVFPAVLSCLNFNVFVFLLLTEGSECILYSVTEDMNE